MNQDRSTVSRRNLIVLLVAGLAHVAGLTGCSASTAPDERIGSTESNIANGSDDTSEDWHNSAVQLGGCTGTLITPTIVLTAAHCYPCGTSPTGTGMPETVRFGTSISAPHALSGRVIARPQPCSVAMGPLDVALIELASPVPAGNWTVGGVTIQVKPVHPWGPTDVCPDHFEEGSGGLNLGMATGFGRTDCTDGADGATLAVSRKRLDVAASTEDGMYKYEFGNPGSTYRGTCKGDSGGPLFRQPMAAPIARTPLVCGILSGTTETPSFPPIPPTTIHGKWASVRTPEVRSLIAAWAEPLGLGSGWRGECPIGLPVDDDVDGYPNACDKCKDGPLRPSNTPSVTGTQWSDQNDRDGDGVGDICDNCPDTPNADQANANLAEEEARAASLGLFGFPNPDNYAFWGEGFRNVIRGDACDTVPTTNFQQTDQRYSPAWAGMTAGPPPSGPDDRFDPEERIVASGVDPTNPLTWPDPLCHTFPPKWVGVATNNVFGATSSPDISKGNEDGSTRVLQCRCTAGWDCQVPPFNCTFAPQPTLPKQGSKWARASLRDPVEGTIGYGNSLAFRTAVVQPGLTPLMAPIEAEFLHTHHTSGFDPAFPNRRTWGWRYWHDLPGLPSYTKDQDALSDPSAIPVWQGQLWSFVHGDRPRGTVASVGSIFPPDIEVSPETRRGVIRHVAIHEDYTPLRNYGGCTLLMDRPNWLAWRDCPMCDHVMVARQKSINPVPLHVYVTPGGVSKRVDVFSSRLAAMMAVSQNDAFFSTDPGGPYHGAIVDGGRLHALITELGTRQYDVETVPDHAVSGIPASSGKRQEIAFFQPPSAGHPGGSIQVYHFAAKTSVVRDVLGAETLGTPLSATYRAGDDAYYVVDEKAGQIRVLRMDLAGYASVRGSWAKTGTYTDYAIARDADDILTVSSWSLTDHATLAFEVQADGSLVPFARDRGAGGLAAPSLRRGGKFQHTMQMGQEEALNVVSLFGGGGTSTAEDVPATSAAMLPFGGAFGPDGAFYYGDPAGGLGYGIRRIATDGTIRTVAGHGGYGDSGDDGPALGAAFTATSVAVAADGSIYVADAYAARVRRVSPAGVISTFAGTGTAGYSGDGGLATAAQLANPSDVAIGPDGSVYIADTGNYVVRRVNADGHISTFAGTPGVSALGGSEGDGGPATSARFVSPTNIAVSASGVVYITDAYTWRVRKVDPSGVITGFAGAPGYPPIVDGRAASTSGLHAPSRVALAADGSVFIACADHIRVVDPRGKIGTFAGKYADPTTTSCGDTGPARQTRFGGGGSGINGLAIGPDGALYVTDATSCGLPPRIRKIQAIFPGGVTGAFQDKNVPVDSPFTPGAVAASDVAQCF